MCRTSQHCLYLCALIRTCLSLEDTATLEPSDRVVPSLTQCWYHTQRGSSLFLVAISRPFCSLFPFPKNHLWISGHQAVWLGFRVIPLYFRKILVPGLLSLSSTLFLSGFLVISIPDPFSTSPSRFLPGPPSYPNLSSYPSISSDQTLDLVATKHLISSVTQHFTYPALLALSILFRILS